MPRAATKSNLWQKSCKSYFLTDPAPTQGHGMSVKFEKPIDELTVQVWLLYHHSNFKYCQCPQNSSDRRDKYVIGPICLISSRTKMSDDASNTIVYILRVRQIKFGPMKSFS